MEGGRPGDNHLSQRLSADPQPWSPGHVDGPALAQSLALRGPQAAGGSGRERWAVSALTARGSRVRQKSVAARQKMLNS